MRLKILLFFAAMALIIAGCNVINPAEPTPTYIQIDSFHFSAGNNQGSAAHGITSAWIYYNNKPVGAFDIPCTVPVITEGQTGTISIVGGISLNGLVDLQPIYPFYAFDTFTLSTMPGQIVKYTPKARYTDAAKFPYKEDFEVGSSFQQFIPGQIGDTTISKTFNPDYVFEGGGSGLIWLNTTDTSSESISNTGFPIPQGEAFIEINYKGSTSFDIGLYNTLDNGIDAYEYFWTVKASDTWKKIYIELGTYTGKYKGKNHKVLIRSKLPSGKSEAFVAIDNIKIVTY